MDNTGPPTNQSTTPLIPAASTPTPNVMTKTESKAKAQEQPQEQDIATTPQLTVYYHNLNFRGHFIFCLLDYVNVPYTVATLEEMWALKNQSPSECPAKFMAPPLLHDHELKFYLSQTPAVVAHLHRKHFPPITDFQKMAMGDKMMNDCNDVLAGLTRNNGSKMWTLKEWEDFASHRFVKWLAILEETAKQQGLVEHSGYFLGTSTASFADTTAVATLYNMEWALGNAMSIMLRQHAPCVMNLCDRMVASSDKLQARFPKYDSTIRQVKYCGGQIERSIRSVLAGGDGSYE